MFRRPGKKPPEKETGSGAEAVKGEKAANDPKKNQGKKEDAAVPDKIPEAVLEKKKEEDRKTGGSGKKGANAEETPAIEKEKEASKPADSLKDLISQKEEIEALLSSIEDAYREATLPDKTYHEVKTKNEKKLQEIEKRIQQMGGSAEAAEGAKESGSTGQEASVVPSAEVHYETQVPEKSYAREEKPSKKASKEKIEVPDEADGQIKPPEMVRLLEEKIEERFRDIIAQASVEITDKRIRKMDERMEALDSSLKDVKKTSEKVETFDKHITNINNEVERMKALVEGTKEAKNVIDDKMLRMTENFAEIRSIVYQREASSKENEVDMDKIKEAISHVDTARVMKEFTTRDEQMRDINTRMERTERSVKMLSDSLTKIKGLMTDIGSLENIMKASKHVGERLEAIQEIEERIKATATKLNGLYVDMSKKIDEFNVYRVRQDKLAGMSEDISKNVEEMTRRLSDYATKSDMESLKQEVGRVEEEAKKPRAAPVSPEIAKLQEEKEQIEILLSTLEENLKNKEISEEDYTKAYQSNIQKLKETEKRIVASPGAASSGGGGPELDIEFTGKHKKIMLLAKLKESYQGGEISKKAYDRTRKILMSK